MASSHRHHHHPCPQHSIEINHVPSPCYPMPTRYCPCDFSSCQPHPDQLLQAITSYLQKQQEQRDYCSYQSHLLAESLGTRNSFQRQRIRHQKHRVLQQEENCHAQGFQTRFLLSDLLRRLDALESSLQGFSVQTDRCCRSLKDAAARVIQTHYRSFLVRRSRVFRNLKELANVKSRFLTLRSSVSGKLHFNFEAVSQKAMAMLLKLDTIQGVDPMVSDGKRTLTRDLMEFLDFIEEHASKRTEFLYKASKNVRFGSNGSKGKVFRAIYGDTGAGKREKMEDRMGEHIVVAADKEEDPTLEGFYRIIDDSEGKARIIINRKHSEPKTKSMVWMKGRGGQPKMKKTVRFEDRCPVYEFRTNSVESNSTEEEFSNEENVALDDYRTHHHYLDVDEVKHNDGDTDDEEAETENGSSSQESNGGISSSREIVHGGRMVSNNKEPEIGDKGIVFSAPLPVKMETRGGT